MKCGEPVEMSSFSFAAPYKIIFLILFYLANAIHSHTNLKSTTYFQNEQQTWVLTRWNEIALCHYDDDDDDDIQRNPRELTDILWIPHGILNVFLMF